MGAFISLLTEVFLTPIPLGHGLTVPLGMLFVGKYVVSRALEYFKFLYSHRDYIDENHDVWTYDKKMGWRSNVDLIMEQLKATIDLIVQFLNYPLIGGWLSLMNIIYGIFVFEVGVITIKYFSEKLGY